MKPLLFALALTGTSVAGTASLSYAAPTAPVAVPAPKSAATSMPATATPANGVPANGVPANGVAADVNGDKIMLADLNRQVEDIKASEPALQTNSPEATQALVSLRGKMLDDLISSKLLSQEARRRKIVVAPKDIDALIDQTRKRFKTEADFNKWLTSRGVSLGQLRSILTDESAMDELTAQITSDVTVSDADVAKYIPRKPGRFHHRARRESAPYFAGD